MEKYRVVTWDLENKLKRKENAFCAAMKIVAAKYRGLKIISDEYRESVINAIIMHYRFKLQILIYTFSNRKLLLKCLFFIIVLFNIII
ncbi:MAG: hypothetical protein QXV94_04870 [Thermoplasmata archaeon]